MKTRLERTIPENWQWVLAAPLLFIRILLLILARVIKKGLLKARAIKKGITRLARVIKKGDKSTN